MVEVHERAVAVVAKARDERRELNASEQADVKKLGEEFDHAMLLVKVEDQEALLGQSQGRRVAPYNPRSTPGDRDGAMDWLVSLARTGQRTGLAGAVAAMSIGSDADGGFAVPEQLDSELQTVAANVSPLLKLCKSVAGVGDGYMQNVSTTLPASAWVPEGGTRSATASPVLAQVTFSRGGVYAAVSCSQWALQDAKPDLYAFIVGELGRQFGAAIGAAITTGDGTNKPKGLTAQILAATADGARAFGTVEYIATGGATTAPTIDHCVSALSKLHPEYQAKAAWLMSPSAAAALMTSKASTAGSYLWQPDPASGQPITLLGKPCFIDPNLPAATTGGSYSIWLGDWTRAYTVVLYGRPIMVRDDVTSKGNVILYAEQRVGGNITDSSALKAIKTSAS